MKNNKNNPQHQLFNNTIKDIRRLTADHTNVEEKRVMGLAKKNNSKMPLTHLMGRRKKLKERYRNEKERAKEENVQYDSCSNLLNSDFMERIKEKDEFVRNRYKFNQNIGSSVGTYKGGVLTLSDGDLRRINGGQGKPAHLHGDSAPRTKHIKKGGRNGGRKGGKKKSRHHKQ